MHNTRVSWDAESTVTLGKVNWDNANLPYWPTVQARDDYFSTRAASQGWPSWQNSKFLRVSEPITIDLPYSEAYRYNYCIVENAPEMGAEGGRANKLFYYVTSCTPTSRGGCTITVDLDVWTTRINSVEFGRSYVTKGHVLMADENANSETNIPRTLNRYYMLDEGLGVGDELQEVYKKVFTLDNVRRQLNYVIIVSTCDLSKSFGTEYAPKLNTASGEQFDGMVSGCNMYAINPAIFTDFLNEMSDYPWITQNIIAMYTVPSSMIYLDYNDPGTLVYINEDEFGQKYPARRLLSQGTYYLGQIYANDYKTHWRPGTEWAADLKKLWASPYTVIVLEASNGNSIALKTNLLNSNVVTLNAYSVLMYPFMRVGVMPSFYGGDSASVYTYEYKNLDSNATQTGTMLAGDWFSTALWLTEFPSFSIVNNSYISYVASNANRIAATRQNASLNKTQSLTATALGLENTRRLLDAELANQETSQTAATHTTAVSALANTLGSLFSGGPGSALGSAASGLTNLYNLSVSQNAESENLARSTSTQYRNAGVNAALANAQTELSYANEMRTLNAGIADAALTPPTSSGQAGGDGFSYKIGTFALITAKIMRISPQYVSTIGTLFKRYGYVTNSMVDMSACPLSLMSQCTYWQTSDIYIECADADETEKAAIRAMFNSGLTVWEDPDAIGKTNIKLNEPIPTRTGVYLD